MIDLLLSRIQHWLTTNFDGLSNPWTDPMYFFEDVSDAVVFFLEDYFYGSPIFWFFLSISIINCAIKTALYLRRDYLRFLSLGRGGRPSTLRGWLQNKLYQFLLMDIIGVDVLSTPFVNPYLEPYIEILCRCEIPQRLSQRPEVMGIDPTRQRTDGNPAAMQWIMGSFVAVGLMAPEAFRYQISYLTGLPALTRNLPGAAPNGTPNIVTELGGEVAHVRPDGSTMVCLHPSDADKVIKLGWGQRSPLAVMDEIWLWRFIHHRILGTRTPLPHNMVIIYSPRDEDDLFIFNLILSSAVWWAYSQPLQ